MLSHSSQGGEMVGGNVVMRLFKKKKQHYVIVAGIKGFSTYFF